MNIGNNGKLFFDAFTKAIGSPTLNSVMGSKVKIIERMNGFILDGQIFAKNFNH